MRENELLIKENKENMSAQLKNNNKWNMCKIFCLEYSLSNVFGICAVILLPLG